MRTHRTRQKGWIGVDLGTCAVKIAQVEKVGPRYCLGAALVVSRPEQEVTGVAAGLAVAEPVPPGPDLSAWTRRVRPELRRDFAGRHAACVLSLDRAELRPMNLPPGSPPERRAMIAAELQESYEAPLEGRVFDYWDTRGAETAPGSHLENVNVLCLAEAEAAEAAATLGRLGLRCEVIDGLPTALARAVAMVQPDIAEPVAAVDWGARNATLCLVHQGTAVYTRQLRGCGYAALPSAVQRALGLPAGDAQQLLCTYGVVDPSAPRDPRAEVQDVLTDIVAEPVAALVAEIQRTLAYPELHRAALLPSRLWLFGGGATVRNIAPYLRAKIGLPVQPWRLEGPSGRRASEGVLVGPAAALSALAWE